MYGVLPSFILGFHGCDESVAEQIFAGKSTLKASENDYDWLGHGVYFWKNNPACALQYAQNLKDKPLQAKSRIEKPAVVGAVIDLRLCLNLLDAEFIALMKTGYETLKSLHEQAGSDPALFPANKRVKGTADLLLRHLDCAVIQTIHAIRKENNLLPFDSVRGVFVEGRPIYPGAGVNEFNHIQVCVRNIKCIKGYFRVISES